MTHGPMLARVALPIPGRGDGVFQYSVGDEMRASAVVGAGVIVPLGSRRVDGFIVGFDREPVPGVRPIHAVLSLPPVLPHLFALGEWISEHYICPLHDALKLMTPPPGAGGTLIVLSDEPAAALDEIRSFGFPEEVTDEIAALLPDFAGTGLALSECLRRLGRESQQAFRTLVREGVLSSGRSRILGDGGRQIRLYGVPGGLTEIEVAQMRELSQVTRRQAQVLEALLNAKPMPLAGLARLAGCSDAVIRTLLEKRFIEEKRPEGRGTEERSKPPILTGDQSLAVSAIKAALSSGETATFLLHGVTGSGKTEVYLQCMAFALEQGRQALMVLPEIALTPQLLRQVRARFGSRAAILHSALPSGYRRSEWYRVERGEAPLVLGARSALFAPMARPGLIILDEEHEASFKQEESPRYHAREVAERLAAQTGATVILGSATPAVETFYRAQEGELRYLSMPTRIGERPLPATTVVDMREELKAGNRSIFSRVLRTALKHTLDRGEQSILFLNRRGYSTFVLCRSCGQAVRCPHCDVSMIYHIPGTRLKCHYCGHETVSPQVCPSCGSQAIRYFGTGTQKIEDELTHMLPGARISRMDIDTTGRKGSHEEIYRAVAERRVDILVGTQMVAKGLDLPGVTLVGIISADTSLHLPDFRAGERAFQLVTQVSGRAGRGERPGQVILQTYNPMHYSICSGAAQDYASFYENEIAQRREGFYPPFSDLVHVSATGASPDAARRLLVDWASEFGVQAGRVNTEAMGQLRYEILGPVPATVARVQNRFRFHLLVKGAPAGLLFSAASKTVQAVRAGTRGTVLTVDINPISVI